MAALTTSLTRLRSDFNTRFPDRDSSSDGWIGDQNHQQYASGHNPDESGVPERYDSDSKDEVRAIDVDDDLRDDDGVTMQACVNELLACERDRKRLIYVIYNRQIWSKSSGWVEEYYSGSNPHDKHAHFSGDPAYDEDDAPYTSILEAGETVSKQNVIDGLQQDTTFQHPGAGARLEEAGWGNMSNRDIGEYVFENTINADDKLDALLAAVSAIPAEVLAQLAAEVGASVETMAQVITSALGHNPARISAVAEAMKDLADEIAEEIDAEGGQA